MAFTNVFWKMSPCLLSVACEVKKWCNHCPYKLAVFPHGHINLIVILNPLSSHQWHNNPCLLLYRQGYLCIQTRLMIPDNDKYPFEISGYDYNGLKSVNLSPNEWMKLKTNISKRGLSMLFLITFCNSCVDEIETKWNISICVILISMKCHTLCSVTWPNM